MWIHWQHAYLYFLNKYLPFPCISERVSEYFQFLFIVLKFCSILFWLTQLLTGRQLLNFLAPSVTFFRCFCIGSNRSFQPERLLEDCLLVSACLASENVHLPSSFTCVWVHMCVQMLTHMCVSMECSSIILHIIHWNMISPWNLTLLKQLIYLASLRHWFCLWNYMSHHAHSAILRMMGDADPSSHTCEILYLPRRLHLLPLHAPLSACLGCFLLDSHQGLLSPLPQPFADRANQ